MANQTLSFLFALAVPVIWGVMNVLDKYVVERRVKNVLSYAVIAGFVDLCIGCTVAFFVDWNGVSFVDILPSCVSGILLGLLFFFYFFLLDKEDVSKFIGLIFIYPIFIIPLSIIFLSEVLSIVSYLGIFFILIGIFFLAKVKGELSSKKLIVLILFYTFLVALYEFLIKVSVGKLSELQGVAVASVFIGVTVLCGIFARKIRIGIFNEVKNIPWALLIESLTFTGLFATYLAMKNLPASVVSSVSAIQPIVVLGIEILFLRFGIDLSEDERFGKKFLSLLLIVVGIAILYFQEVV